MKYFTPQTPLTIALFGKLFSSNLIFHTENIDCGESHTRLEAGIETCGNQEGRKMRLQLSEVRPGFRKENGD